MRKTVTEIASLVSGNVVGDGSVVIKGVSGLKEARDGDISFLANDKYLPLLKDTRASAVIVSRDVTQSDKSLIQTDNPSLAFTQIVNILTDTSILPSSPRDIHPTAVIGSGVRFGKGVGVGPFVVIEDNVVIGDGSVIFAHSYVGHSAAIGKECVIYPMVTIRECVQISDRVMIHSGTVVGSDGFGFLAVDGEHIKIPQTGTVVIESDVEIGANVTIDRARFHQTVIGRGTKVDNLVQIAHNVQIGESCILVSQVGISGSAVIESGAILAGQVGIAGHITVGEKALIMGKSGVSKSVKAGAKMFGTPAQPFLNVMEQMSAMHRLPRLLKKVKDLEQRLAKLEEGSS